MDANRLGQSDPTAFGHDIGVYAKRFEAFGWRVETIDGHDIEEIIEVLNGVGLDDKPLAIIAKTYKGAGVSFLQDKEGWHGKPLNNEEATKAIAELQPSAKSGIGVPIPAPNPLPAPANAVPANYPPISYKLGDKIATREAYGTALARIGETDLRIVAVDGDTKNSTYAEKFFKNSRIVPSNVSSRNKTWSAWPPVLARAAKCRLRPLSRRFSRALMIRFASQAFRNRTSSSSVRTSA